MSAAKLLLKNRWKKESNQCDVAAALESMPVLTVESAAEGPETASDSPPVLLPHDDTPDTAAPTPSSDTLKPPQFIRITENIYQDGNERKSKDAKAMRCDCSPNVEDDRDACGDDCWNRMLYMECGSRCPSGALCTNKRFQKRQYAAVEPRPAGSKGFGLFAVEPIKPSQFVIEYVGEVLDVDRLQRRLRRYGKDSTHKHHYFMALKNGEVIDATEKGSISRFINHSCDPNCETQKWTVNRQLRIGFFAKRDISAGEELTFDYKFERYGKEAQECFCGTAKCTGFIGGQLADDDGEEEEGGSEAEQKEQRSKTRRRKALLEDNMLSSQLDRLVSCGRLRNKQHVIDFNRLMVRGDEFENRVKLLQLLLKTEQTCLRLFVDLHGCSLIWSWMIDNENISTDELRQLRKLLLQVLNILPIQHRNMLEDSNVLPVVRRWANPQKSHPSVERDVASLVRSMLDRICSDGDDSPSSSDATDTETLLDDQIRELSSLLLDKWSTLKENFKIPKKTKSGNVERDKAGNVVTERVWRVGRATRDEPRRSSLLERRQIRAAAGGRYNRPLFEGGKGPKRERSRSKSPIRSSLPPEPKRRRESRFDKRSPVHSRTPSSLNSGSNSERLWTTEERRRHFEASAEAMNNELDEQMQKDEFESEYQNSIAADLHTPSETLAPVPMPGQEHLLALRAEGGARPAVLVNDPNSGMYWWQEPSSGTLVYPATEEQLAFAQMGNWSQTPYFAYDGVNGLIRELKLEIKPQQPDTAPVPPPAPVVSTVLPPDISPEAQIVLLQQQIEQLRKVAETNKRTDKNTEEVDMELELEETETARPSVSSSADDTVVVSKVAVDELPTGWSHAKDSEGNVYYYNTKTRETQWEPPTPSPTKSLEPVVSSSKSKSKRSETTQAAADTSSEVRTKSRERFKAEISKYVIKCLSVFKNRFSSDDDFKHLARKLSHAVLEKEKRVGQKDELKVTDAVKKKSKEYIKSYMKNKVGTVYKRKST